MWDEGFYHEVCITLLLSYTFWELYHCCEMIVVLCLGRGRTKFTKSVSWSAQQEIGMHCVCMYEQEAFPYI